MLDGFYCNTCKTEFDIPKFRVLDDNTEIFVCPHCKNDDITEVIDGEILESEDNADDT